MPVEFQQNLKAVSFHGAIKKLGWRTQHVLSIYCCGINMYVTHYYDAPSYQVVLMARILSPLLVCIAVYNRIPLSASSWQRTLCLGAPSDSSAHEPRTSPWMHNQSELHQSTGRYCSGNVVKEDIRWTISHMFLQKSSIFRYYRSISWCQVSNKKFKSKSAKLLIVMAHAWNCLFYHCHLSQLPTLLGAL